MPTRTPLRLVYSENSPPSKNTTWNYARPSGGCLPNSCRSPDQMTLDQKIEKIRQRLPRLAAALVALVDDLVKRVA